MDTRPPLFWTACLCIWSPPSRGCLRALLQMPMTKDAFGGSRVIHGQNCPISDEISQKLDLYSDRPKSGRRLYAGRPHNHPHMGGRPRQSSCLKYFTGFEVFPRLQSTRYTRHTLVQTRPVRPRQNAYAFLTQRVATAVADL